MMLANDHYDSLNTCIRCFLGGVKIRQKACDHCRDTTWVVMSGWGRSAPTMSDNMLEMASTVASACLALGMYSLCRSSDKRPGDGLKTMTAIESCTLLHGIRAITSKTCFTSTGFQKKPHKTQNYRAKNCWKIASANLLAKVA